MCLIASSVMFNLPGHALLKNIKEKVAVACLEKESDCHCLFARAYFEARREVLDTGILGMTSRIFSINEGFLLT